jgi:hemerythrin-like domain-containing protein
MYKKEFELYLDGVILDLNERIKCLSNFSKMYQDFLELASKNLSEKKEHINKTTESLLKQIKKKNEELVKQLEENFEKIKKKYSDNERQVESSIKIVENIKKSIEQLKGFEEH